MDKKLRKHFYVVSIDFEDEGFDEICNTTREVLDMIHSHLDTAAEEGERATLTTREYFLNEELSNKLTTDSEFFQSDEWCFNRFPEGVVKNVKVSQIR